MNEQVKPQKTTSSPPNQPPPPLPPPLAEEPKRTVKPLGIDAFGWKEHRNPGHWACVEFGTPLEDVLEPAFWANVASKMSCNHTIEVHWPDGNQYAELYVRACGRNWADVWLMRHCQADKAAYAPSKRNQLVVAWAGPVDKFRVTRTGDNAVIMAGFQSEADAHRWRDEYLRKLNS
jgi:hypothetical protein